MQGMRFLVINEKGPVNHGIIQQKLTDEKYLVTFVRIPQVSRVASLDEISTWNLFPNEDAMNAFIVDLRKQQATPPDDKANPNKVPPIPGKKIGTKRRAKKIQRKVKNK